MACLLAGHGSDGEPGSKASTDNDDELRIHVTCSDFSEREYLLDPGIHRRTAWGVQKGKRRRQGHPRNGRKAVSVVARPQGIEGSGMAGPVETLGSPWPLATPCHPPMPGIHRQNRQESNGPTEHERKTQGKQIRESEGLLRGPQPDLRQQVNAMIRYTLNG
jgi:hypothetical protein